MSFKSNGTKRDSRKVLCGVIMFIMSIMFIVMMFTNGFSIVKLIFAAITFYLSTAFYRLSNEV